MLDIIETERLIIRNPRLEDLNDYHRFASKSNVGPSAGWLAHTSLNESKRVLKTFIRDKDVWVITLKGYDTFIGTIDLRRYDYMRGYELGYSLDDTHWHKGYATEAVSAVIDYAFNTLLAKRVVASHSIDNIASKKVLLKNQFIETHTEETNHYISVGIYKLIWYELKNPREEN